jgi:hypothetical protein
MSHSLGASLTRHPVIATLYGLEQIERFIDSAAETAIVANVELSKLQAVVELLMKAGKGLTSTSTAATACRRTRAGWITCATSA